MPAAKINGIDINYIVLGKGEPLVLITGTGAALNAWRSQTAFFGRYYRVVAFDNRGAGKSGKPDKPYSIKTMADDTVGLMSHLGMERAHILGFSMGGAIAQEIAINYPEKVNKLILSSTFACNDNKLNGGTPAEIEVSKLPLRQVMYRQLMLAANKRTARTFYAPFVWFQSRFMSQTDLTGLRGQIEALRTYDTLDRLSLIKAPTLIIAGDKDRAVRPTSSDTLARLIPHARLVKVPDGSHMVCTEMSKTFNEIVLNFLRDNS